MNVSTEITGHASIEGVAARLLEAAGEALLTLGRSGHVTYANAAAERLFGWDAGERPSSDVVAGMLSEETDGAVPDLISRLRNGHEWSGCLRVKVADGSCVRVHVTATPVIDDGRLTDVLVVASEVSERERSQAQPADSEAALREAQRVAHIGHWRWNVGADRIEWLADEVYAIHGVESSWVGTVEQYLALVPPPDHELVRAASEEVLRTGSADVIHRIVRPDGAVRHVRNRSEAIHAVDGTPVVVLGTCQDVTDLVVLREAYDERVKELTCLVAVGQALHEVDDLPEVYACVAAALVLAMQYPERAVAVVNVDGQQHSSDTSGDLLDLQQLVDAPVMVRGRERGRIYVGYDNGSADVIPEERALLEAVASMVALWLERRESALSAAEAESRFRRLLHNIPDAVFRFRLGSDIGVDYVSPAVESLTGYRAEELMADPQLVGSLFGTATTSLAASATVTQTGGAGGVTQVTDRDGRQRWLEYNLTSVVGQDGTVVAVEGVARDVTERVVATEATLDRAHEQAVLARISEAAVSARVLDEVFEIATKLVAETLPVQGTFVSEMTANADELILRSGVGWPDGTVGKAFQIAGSLAEQTLASDRPMVWADLHNDEAVIAPILKAHGFVSGISVRIAGKEGAFGTLGALSTTATAYSTHHVAFLQTVAHILAAAVDRWKAEAALAARERQFRTLTENLPDIVRRVDRGHRHLYVNPAVEILGTSPADLIGRTLREVGLPSGVADVLEREADSVFTSGRRCSVDFEIQTSGGPRHLQSVMIPEFENNDTVGSVIALTRDLTAVRRAERLRREALGNIVAAQEDERRRVGEDIHDDSIQVMTAVGMRLEGLRRHIDDPDAMAVLGRLEEVVRHSVTRLRALMFELRPPALDREGLAAALCLYLEATLPEDSLQATVVDDWPGELPLFVRNVLYRIAMEAITNARKHAEASSVEVVLEAARGGVQMQVRDDGSGFDVTALAHVGPHHVGTTSMRERAEAAGGTLDIQSSPESGTVVTAWLPADAQTAGDK